MINVLDSSIVDKIAAGEVVERPASIVKELLENSIDAGASIITIEIKNGGIDLIRVTDNGCGISKDEIKIAFLRHATSKISTDKDLLNIQSLGFRGEALSSISAVTKSEMISKTRSQLIGTRYCMEGGKNPIIEEIGAPDGTTIIVRDLFFNTPARRKFLKSSHTEAAYISDYVEKLALANTNISIRFINNNQTKLHTTGNGNLKDTIYNIYGRDVANALLEIDYNKNGIKIEGYIAKPEFSKGNRNLENYYINNRFIKDKSISLAIEEGFGNRMMQHQYPFTVLRYSINSEVVDVNVHPAKMQVRFSNTTEIYEATREAVQNALVGKELIREVSIDKENNVKKSFLDTLYQPKQDFTQRTFTNKTFTPNIPKNENVIKDTFFKANEDKPKLDNSLKKSLNDVVNAGSILEIIKRPPESFETRKNTEYTNLISQSISESPEKYNKQLEFLDRKNKHLHRIVGQVFDTYWIVEFDNKMYIIDQHAAHEKVLYEKFIKVYNETKISTQMISPPVIISLSSLEISFVEKNKEVLSKMGFEIESFGGKEIKISGIPSILPSISKYEVLKEIIGNLSENDVVKTPELIISKTASMACKAAVKGNDRLSFEEAKKLIDDLFELENPYSCPHGRPTIIEMTKQELEKKFKRIV
jgi:DNA mismatch repair protein mutL